MAPPIRYVERPHQQLVRLAIKARARGLAFAAFWSEAMNEGGNMVMETDVRPPPHAVRWPTDGHERIDWRESIVACREMWERAYNRELVTERERALLVLADAFGIKTLVASGDLVAA